MPRKRLTELPEGLWVKLAELEQYVRQLDMVRGFGWTLAVAAICVAGGLVADLTLELPLSFRLGMLVSAVSLTLAAAFAMLWRPWRRQRTDIDLAALVERSHPELKEGLVSCIELYDPSIPERDRGSPLMRELSAKQALQKVAPLDFCDSVSSRPAHRMAVCGLLAWAMLLLPLIAPSSYRLLFARFLTPWQNLDRVTTFWFDVEQGDRVVVRGSDVTLTAHPRGFESSFPETVNLNWVDTQGESDARRVDYDATNKVYATTIPHVMQDFEYYLTGAGNRSRNYRIRVVEAPAITSLKLQVQPPAYTGQPAKLLDGVPSDLAVLEQTGLDWKLTFNKPMVGAEWHWLPPQTTAQQPAANAEANAEAAVNQEAAATDDDSGVEKIPIKLSADKLSAAWRDIARRSGEFRLVVRDEHGLTNEGDVTRVLTVTPDLAPTLSVSGSPEGDTAKATDIVPVLAEATDDLGVGALELHVEVDATRNKVIKCDPKGLGTTRVEHRFELGLSELQVKDGEMVSYRVRAADERPVPGPNETWSDRRMIRIDSQAKAPGTQELAAEQTQLKEFLKKLTEDVTQQKQTTDELHANAAEAAKNPAGEEPVAAQQRQEKIEETADKQAELQARLEQLKTAFNNHPLFANLTDQVQDLSDKEFTDAQKALSDAEQAELAPRAEKLQAAGQQLKQAEEKLGTLEQQLDKLAKLEQDLLELNRLAASAEQLADKLRDLERRQQDPAPQNETPQQQETREQIQKAEENQLAAQQKELLQQADDLMQRQPELGQAVQDKLNEQLQQLAKQAEQLAEPQQNLASDLQQAAREAAEENQDLAEQHADLQKRAEELSKDLAKQPQSGVKPIDPEELRKALDELAAGNLGAAAEEEKRLAEKLEELEEQLRQAEQEQANASQPEQMARQLAKQQAQAAKNAQEAAQAGMPQSNEAQAAATDDLAERQSQLEKLQAGEAAEKKQAAADALQKAVEAQRADPNDQQRSLDKNAAAQQAAAEKLAELADELAKQSAAKKQTGEQQVASADKPGKTDKSKQPAPAPEKPADPNADSASPEKNSPEKNSSEQNSAEQNSQQKNSQQQNSEQQNGEQDKGAQGEKPGAKNAAAEQAKQLAQEARDLQKQVEKAQLTQNVKAPQEKQEQLQQMLKQLDQQIESACRKCNSGSKAGSGTKGKPPGLAQAQEQMERAAQQLEEGNLEKASEAAKKSAEALQQAAQSSPMEGSPMEPSSEKPGEGEPGEGKPGEGKPGEGKAGENTSPNEGAPPSKSPVPAKAASEVADAVEQLKEALSAPPPTGQEQAGSEQGSQPANKPSNQSPAQEGAKPGETATEQPPSNGQEKSGDGQAGQGKPEGKAGEGKPGEGKPGEGKSNSGQPGASNQSQIAQAAGQGKGSQKPTDQPAPNEKSPPSPVEQAAQRLQKAAESLRQASAQLQKSDQPGNQQAIAGNQPPQPAEGQPNGEATQQPPAEGESGKPGAGGGGIQQNVGATDEGNTELARLKKRLKGRKWGELPGTLQTEILQAAQKKPNSEYADLIRQYFKEIAKTQPAAPKPVEK